MNKAAVLIEQIKSKITKFRKSVQSDIDTSGASYFMCFTIKEEFSLDVVDALKKDSIDVSLIRDSFGSVDIKVLINKYKNKSSWWMQNGSSIGLNNMDNPDELTPSRPFVPHPAIADEITGYTWLKEAIEKGAIIPRGPYK
jgi:hypothetical protein